MKLQVIDLEMYGMTELSIEDQLSTSGETWSEFCNAVGYTVGSAVAYATNAADVIGQALFSDLVGKSVTGGLKK